MRSAAACLCLYWASSLVSDRLRHKPKKKKVEEKEKKKKRKRKRKRRRGGKGREEGLLVDKEKRRRGKDQIDQERNSAERESTKGSEMALITEGPHRGHPSWFPLQAEWR